MKHRKYWAGRLRMLGDVIAVSATVVAVIATGRGSELSEVLPYVVGTLVVVLVLWLAISIVTQAMEGDDE